MIWSSDDGELVSCGDDGGIFQWEIPSGKRSSELVIKGCPIKDLTRDPKHIYAVDKNNRILQVSESLVRAALWLSREFTASLGFRVREVMGYFSHVSVSRYDGIRSNEREQAETLALWSRQGKEIRFISVEFPSTDDVSRACTFIRLSARLATGFLVTESCIATGYSRLQGTCGMGRDESLYSVV